MDRLSDAMTSFLSSVGHQEEGGIELKSASTW